MSEWSSTTPIWFAARGFDQITLRAEQVIEALSAEVKLELRALAESMKRSIAQRVRRDIERMEKTK